MRWAMLALVMVAFGTAGCGGARLVTHGPPHRSSYPSIASNAIRSPDARTSMDTNPANLASAVVTHAFGQLPEYIDDANFRLLPYDRFGAFEPGHTRTQTYRIEMPHRNAAAYSVSVTLDGAVVPRIRRYWVAYRNNGPLICRIYFRGDLSSLNMDVHSLVLRPLPAGSHRLRVTVVHRSPGVPAARAVTTYALNVLARGPSAAERAIAPEEDGPKPPSRTPLALIDPRR